MLTCGLCMQRIKAEIVMWTAGFVLLTLIVNAPLLPWVLRITGLSKGAHYSLVLVLTWVSTCFSDCAGMRQSTAQLSLKHASGVAGLAAALKVLAEA